MTAPMTEPGARAALPDGVRISVLVGGLLVLVACFVRLPAAVAGLLPGAPDGAEGARRALGPALEAYRQAGVGPFPSRLQTLVDYWMVWHATKIAIALGLVVLSVLLRRAGRRRSAAGRRPTRWAGVVGSVAAVLSLGLLVVNVQATAAPSIALLPLLSGDEGPAARAVLAGMREQLAAGSADSDATLSVLLADASDYHLAMVLAAGTATVVASITAARCRRRRSDQLGPRVADTTELATWILAAAGFGLLLLNSLLALSDPASALLDVVGGG